jgi:hypothetical protein
MEPAKNELLRDFQRRSIFDFCNTIQAKADIEFCRVTTPRPRGVCLAATDEFSKTPSRYANEK